MLPHATPPIAAQVDPYEQTERDTLWTRDAVAELIAQRYGVWLARTTVGGYLRGWGVRVHLHMSFRVRLDV